MTFPGSPPARNSSSLKERDPVPRRARQRGIVITYTSIFEQAPHCKRCRSPVGAPARNSSSLKGRDPVRRCRASAEFVITICTNLRAGAKPPSHDVPRCRASAKLSSLKDAFRGTGARASAEFVITTYTHLRAGAAPARGAIAFHGAPVVGWWSQPRQLQRCASRFEFGSDSFSPGPTSLIMPALTTRVRR
jgi:hypothetical protein